MMRKLLYKISGGLPCRLITRDGTPYLERYFLCRIFGLTAYLHRFVGSDGDKEVHNHPWNSMALCLAGGYEEERLTGLCIHQHWQHRLRRIFPGKLNRIRANDFHRIAKTKPETWTLFVHGRCRLGWGFLRPQMTNVGPNHTEVVFHQPFELVSGSPWWTEAPLGRDSGRTPYGVAVLG